MRLRRRRPPVIPGAEVGKLRDETSVDAETGAVTSRQAGDIVLPAAAIEGLWDPEHLERVARTYWTTLQRFTLGLMHVAYTPTERSVVLLIPQLRLLTFKAPEYEMDACRGSCDGGSRKGCWCRSGDSTATATWRSTSAVTTNRSWARCG